MKKTAAVLLLSFCCACVWAQSILTADGLATFSKKPSPSGTSFYAAVFNTVPSNPNSTFLGASSGAILPTGSTFDGQPVYTNASSADTNDFGNTIWYYFANNPDGSNPSLNAWEISFNGPADNPNNAVWTNATLVGIYHAPSGWEGVGTVKISSITNGFSIVANFDSDEGCLSPAGTVWLNPGSNQTFTASNTVANGNFYPWLVDGTNLATNNTFTFSSVTTNHTLSLGFLYPQTISGTNSFTWSATNSYELHPQPTNLFYVGTNNFSFCYWFSETYNNPFVDYCGFELYNSDMDEMWAGFDVNDSSVTNVFDAWMKSNGVRHGISITNLYMSGKWAFICATVNRTNLLKFYINNHLVGSTNISALTNNFSTNMTFAGFNKGGIESGHYNSNQLAGFRFYQTELTAAQISDIFNSGVGKLVDTNVFASITTNGCYWELNDGPPTSLHSPVGYALTNGVWNTNALAATLNDEGDSNRFWWKPGGIPFNLPSPPFYTITSTAGSYGTVTPNGVTWVLAGRNQAFTATPASSEYETNTIWTLDLTNVVAQGTNTYTIVNVTTNHTLAVTFQRVPNTYAVTITTGSHGTVTPNGTNGVVWGLGGSNLVFTSTPDTGYGTVWTLDSNVVAQGTNTYTITNITSDHTLNVTFQQTHTITTTAGSHGTITPTNGVIVVFGGSNLVFNASPDSGYGTVWTLDGGIVAIGTNTYTITNITSDHALAVTFQQTHTITTTAGSHGTITPTNGVIVVFGGSNLVFNASPDSGYGTVWTLDLTNVVIAQGTNTYTITNITSDHALAVTFQQAYNITTTAGSHGTVTPNGVVLVLGGSNLTFNASPDSGYGTTWTFDTNTVTYGINTYTISNVTTNHTLAVTFQPSGTPILSVVLITNPAPAAGANFGYSVAGVGTNGFVVGEPSGGYGSDGQVFLYTNGVLAATITNPAPANGDSFGYSVAGVSTNGFVVGAPNQETSAGQAYLYTNGVLAATFHNPDAASYSQFGWSVAGVGTNGFVVGEPFGGGDGNGQAYLYTNGVSATLIPNPSGEGYFGWSAASVGTNGFVIGSPYGGGNNSGSASYYTNKTLAATVYNPNPPVSDFGWAVAGVGTNGFVVGSPDADNYSSQVGAAYLYTNNGVFAVTITNSTPSSEQFGFSVASVGTNGLVIGAVAGGGDGSGAAYLYTNGVFAVTIANPDPASASGDQFGYSVASVGTNSFVIGTPGKAIGTDPAVGQAYLFTIHYMP